MLLLSTKDVGIICLRNGYRMSENFFTKRKLITIISLILVFSFTFTSILSYNVTRKTIKHNTTTETLPLISDNIYSEIQQILFQPIYNSSLMAHDEFLIDWVLSGELEQDEIIKYLKRIKEEYKYFTAFFVSESTSKYYFYDGILKIISMEDTHDVWYYDFKDLNKPYVLDVDTDEASEGTITVFINHRLEDHAGNFLGVTGIGLKMESIGQTLSNYQKKYGHHIYMIDSVGLIQVHPDLNLVEKLNISDIPGIASLKEKILATKEGTGIYEYRDKDSEVVISARYFPSLDWFLIVEQDQEIPLVPARNYLIGNIVIGIVVTGLVILLVALMINVFHSKIESLAVTDELTGLSNRRKIHDIFLRETAFSRRFQQPLSLLMIDIDHFKSINDQFGHLVGDQYLIELSRALKSRLREIDSVGRWGGEEFVVILQKTDKEQAFQTAERLRESIAKLECRCTGNLITRTISIGVATANAGELNLDEMISIADESLYLREIQG